MSLISHNNALYKVVVTHYLLAALFFLGLAILFTFSLDNTSGHYFQPKLLALTHAAALGWGTMLIFGALNQLLPVIFEKDLFSSKLCWFSLLFFVTGVILLVCGFWFFDTGLCMQIGGILIFIAVLLFNLNVFLTVRGKEEQSVFQEFIITACLWLMVTVLLGNLMVFNFQYPFLQKDHLQFLRLHAHMGIAGWFLLSIIGVSGKLIPMFFVSKYQKTQLLSISYYLINSALLLFLVDGYIYGINVKTYLVFLVGVAGLCFYLTYVYKCFNSRIRKEIDLPMLQTMLSFVWLGLGVLVIPFILYYHLKQDSLAVNLSVFYGILIFMGWITCLILGQTFKTLPFIVWLKHYEHLTGKVKTPLPADLIKKKLLRIQFLAFILFLLAFFAGVLFNALFLKIIAACSLIVTAVAYVVHISTLLLHTTKIKPYDKL